MITMILHEKMPVGNRNKIGEAGCGLMYLLIDKFSA
jgi:hypothetical protein